MMTTVLLFLAGVANLDIRGGSDLIDRIYFKTAAMPDRPGMLQVTLTYYFKADKKRLKEYYLVATKQELRKNVELIFDQPPVTLSPAGEKGGDATVTLVLKDKTRYVQFHLFARLVKAEDCRKGKRCITCGKWGKHIEKRVDSTSRFQLRDGIDQYIIKGVRGR